MKLNHPFRDNMIELIIATVVIFGFILYRCAAEPTERRESSTYKAVYFDDERILIPID